LNRRLVGIGPRHFCARLVDSFAVDVELEEFAKLEPRLLQNLHLPNVHIVERVGSLALLFDVLSDDVWNQFVDDAPQVAARDVANDVLHHLGTDLSDLTVLGIAGLSLGELIFVGESNAENAQKVAIGGFDINVGFDKSLPFLDHAAEFVSRQIHAVEVGQDISCLDVFGDEPEFPEGTLSIGIFLNIGERNFENSPFQTFGSDFGSLSSVDQSFANLALLEHGRSLDIVPVLPGERVHYLLLNSFLPSFRQPLIFTNSHS